MKLNHWLLIPSLILVVASGCTTDYHGPQNTESQMRLPAAMWDNTINTQAGIEGPRMGFQMADDRNYIPANN